VEAARAKKADLAAARKRERRLTRLGRDVDGAWKELEKLVASSAYDTALKLAVDLRDLAAGKGEAAAFARRFEALRKRQMRRRGFLDRWKRLSVGGMAP
jgi:hypothetical protein